MQGKPHKVGVLYIVEGCILVVGALNSIFTELHIVDLFIEELYIVDGTKWSFT